MEVNNHLRQFLHGLCDLHFDISGYIDIEKELFAYKYGGEFCFCDYARCGLDRKEYGIKDDIVVLCEADDCECGIHIFEDKDRIANKRYYIIIDKSNNVIFERKDVYWDINGTFLRINSDSVIFLEDIPQDDSIIDGIDHPCIKSLMSKSDSEKSVVILNGVIQSDHCFLLKYKEYYFFLVDGKCRIYHAKNGIVRECELGFIWFLSNEEAYLIEVITNDENVNEGHVVISSIEGKMLNNFCVPRRDSWNFIHSASSSNHMVLEFLGNWVILHKKPHNIFSATIKPIDNHGCKYYLIQILNDTFVLDDTLYYKYIYDLDGDYIGDKLRNSPKRFLIYPKRKEDQTYYGVLRLDDNTIIIPPIYNEMDYLLPNDDSLFKVTIRDTEKNRIFGVISAEYGQVVPFGCEYYFATYINTYYSNTFKISSDSYLIYELGGYKGLVFRGKNVLGAEYDDIFGFDYSLDLGEFDCEDEYTTYWTPNCVILKKGDQYGLFVDERKIFYPIYDSINIISCSKTVCYFVAEIKSTQYIISNLDDVLLRVPTDYSFVSFGQFIETKIFAFKSKETKNYLFIDYTGATLTNIIRNDKIVLVQWNSKQFAYNIEKEDFLQPRKSKDDNYDYGDGYTQAELNDMYKDAFDGSMEYESNIY